MMCAVQLDSYEKLHRDNSNDYHTNPQHSDQVILMTHITEAAGEVIVPTEMTPMEMLLLKSFLVIRADRGNDTL